METEAEVRAALDARHVTDADLEKVLRLGADAVEPLCAILRDPELWAAEYDAPGFHAPKNAAIVLGTLRDERAIPPLIAAFDLTDPLDMRYSTLIMTLAKFGEEVVEPMLELATSTDKQELRHAAAETLAECGVRDERILALLLRLLDQHVDLGAGLLTAYGDAAALPHLHRAFGKLLPSDEYTFRLAAIELKDAIETLGGELSPTERIKFQDATGGPRAQVPQRQKLGRNDKCWCGSGKKYKRCHYDADRA